MEVLRFCVNYTVSQHSFKILLLCFRINRAKAFDNTILTFVHWLVTTLPVVLAAVGDWARLKRVICLAPSGIMRRIAVCIIARAARERLLRDD